MNLRSDCWRNGRKNWEITEFTPIHELRQRAIQLVLVLYMTIFQLLPRNSITHTVHSQFSSVYYIDVLAIMVQLIIRLDDFWLLSAHIFVCAIIGATVVGLVVVIVVHWRHKSDFLIFLLRCISAIQTRKCAQSQTCTGKPLLLFKTVTTTNSPFFNFVFFAFVAIIAAIAGIAAEMWFTHQFILLEKSSHQYVCCNFAFKRVWTSEMA